MAELKCDLAVLGAGPGGYTAAFRAADLGLSVALIERYPTLGGVCLNVGCIPSKALLHTAGIIDDAAASAGRGIQFGAPQIDLDKLRNWKSRVVGRLTGGLAKMAEQRGVQIVTGTGLFKSPTTIGVENAGDATLVNFRQAIIAAGSRAIRLPNVADDPRIFDSTRALELPFLPATLLIVGGGVIGLELATVYRALGSRVTIVEALDGLMLPVDRDLMRPLERSLRRECEAILTNTRVQQIVARPEHLQVTLNGGAGDSSSEFDAILIAVGRQANGGALGLDAAGVNVDQRGVVAVDAQLRTNVPHIFAIGDVTGPPLLAHRASHQGKTAAEVAAGKKVAFEPRAVPSVAYTNPEIAWVGITETEAKQAGIAYEKSIFPWTASGRAIGMDATDGLTKLLFDPASRRLIGVGITGAHAGDLISEATLAIEMGADAADLALTIHPHPTLAETIAFGAEMFEGTVTDLYLGKRR